MFFALCFHNCFWTVSWGGPLLKRLLIQLLGLSVFVEICSALFIPTVLVQTYIRVTLILFIIICHFEGARFKRLYRLVNQVSVWLVSVFRVLCCFQDSCHVCKMEVELKLIFWVPIRFWLIFVWKSFIITQLSIEWAETRDSLIYIVAWERQFPKGNCGKYSLLIWLIAMTFTAPGLAKLLLLTINWVRLFNPLLVKRWNTPTRVWWIESSHEYYARQSKVTLYQILSSEDCQKAFTRTAFLFALKECFTYVVLHIQQR